MTVPAKVTHPEAYDTRRSRVSSVASSRLQLPETRTSGHVQRGTSLQVLSRGSDQENARQAAGARRLLQLARPTQVQLSPMTGEDHDFLRAETDARLQFERRTLTPRSLGALPPRISTRMRCSGSLVSAPTVSWLKRALALMLTCL